MRVIILANGSWFDAHAATESWLDPTKRYEILRTRHGSYILHNLPNREGQLAVEFEEMSKVAAAYYLNKWGYDVPKSLLMLIAPKEV